MRVRISRFFERAVVVILMLLLAAGVARGILQPEHRSYIAAFAVSLAVFAVYRYMFRRWQSRSDGGILSVLDKAEPVYVCFVLSALCFLSNLIYILNVRVEPSVDFLTYWKTAQTLAENGSSPLHSYVALFPHIFGYAYVLSLFIKLFGAGELLAPLLNTAFTVLSGIMLYCFCLRRCGRRPAAAVYMLWILCPSKTLYNTMVLSEPFYTALLLVFLFVISSLEDAVKCREKSIPQAAAAGVCCAVVLRLVNAARPIAAIPIIALFIWIIFLRSPSPAAGDTSRNRKSTAALCCSAIVLSAVYFPLGPVWDSFTEQKLGIEPSSFPGYSVYVGFNPDSEGCYSDEDMDLLQKYYYDDGMTANEAQQRIFEDAKARLSSGKINFPKLFLSKLGVFLGNDEGGSYYSGNALSDAAYSVFAVLSNIYYYFIVLLVFAGCVRMLLHPTGSCLQLAPLYIIGLTLAHMLVEVAGRYHYSIIPMLLICAVYVPYASGMPELKRTAEGAGRKNKRKTTGKEGSRGRKEKR